MPVKYYTEEEMRVVEIFLGIFKNINYRQKNISEIERHEDTKENKDKFDKCYPFIGFPNYRALATVLIRLIKEVRCIPKCDIKFLDVGCGIGNVIQIANGVGFTAGGIEIDNRLIKRSESIFGKSYNQDEDYDDDDRYHYSHIYNMNAFEFKDYDKYDIIYYYCPIANSELQRKLEALIEKNMKVGAILIPCLKQDLSIKNSKEFKKIEFDDDALDGIPVYKKIEEIKRG